MDCEKDGKKHTPLSPFLLQIIKEASSVFGVFFVAVIPSLQNSIVQMFCCLILFY